jgi:HPt (histidine-containing phosphotransfer) domain-containing protein
MTSVSTESAVTDDLLDREYHRKNYHDLGCSDVLLDVYRIYLESAPQKIGQLRPLVEQGKLEPILALAHGLKGESGSIGGRLIMAAAAAMELAARAGDLHEVQRLMPELELQLQRTIAAIELELKA